MMAKQALFHFIYLPVYSENVNGYRRIRKRTGQREEEVNRLRCSLFLC